MNGKLKFLSPIMLLLAAVIWGTAFTMQKAAEEVPAFTMGTARNFFATIFLLILIPIFDRQTKSGRTLFSKKGPDFNKNEIIGGAVCGFILAIASFFQQYGINSGTDAGKASFITALYVIIVPVYGLFIKRKAPLNVWISVFISVFGFYFLCITGDLKMASADIYVLICAFLFPIHILTIDRFSPKCDGVRMSCVQFFVAGIVSFVFALFTEAPIPLSLVFQNIGPILYLGIGSSGIAYTLQIIGQRGVNPAAASILLSLESVFGVISSAIVLNERMSGREYLGCAIVFAAVILSQIKFKGVFGRVKDRTAD